MEHGSEQLAEARWIVALAVELALATEVTHQPFPAQKALDPAVSELSDFELQGVFEGHDVPRVDDVRAVDGHLIDGAEAVQEHVPHARALDPEHAFAREQGLAEALKATVDLHARTGGEPARALRDQRATVEAVMHHVAAKTWTQGSRSLCRMPWR